MTYKTIALLNQYIENFTYTNPCLKEERTFNWTDVWFGYREEDFYPECDDSINAKEEWDKSARTIDLNDLKRGKNILSLSYHQTSKSLNGNGSGTLTHKETFSYEKDIGFINKFMNKTLQQTLNLTNKETLDLNLIFAKELCSED